MENLKLVLLLLSLFLSLMLNMGIVKADDLSQLHQNQLESNWVPGTYSENENPPVNPLTKHFSVLPRITITEDGNVFVYIFNPNHVVINIGFLDEEANALHRDKTATLYYGKLLNVSELEEGEYKLTLDSNSLSVPYVVKIGRETRLVNISEAAVF
jgi:hypothetical protein